MKKIIIGFAMVTALLMATGCRSTEKSLATTVPEETAPAVEPPAEEMPEEPLTKHTTVAPRTEYTTMSFSGEAEGVSFSGQLRMAKDSVIWCSFSKILELGRAMATPDSVWVKIPLIGRNDAGDYRMVKRLTGVNLTYDELQGILLSDNPEEEIQRLARRLGFNLKVRIKRRERVNSLTFPFKK